MLRNPTLTILLICLLLSFGAFSQGDTTFRTREQKKTDSVKAQIKYDLPIIVLKVYNYNREDTTKNIDSAAIGDIIVVEVQNLDSLLRKARAGNQNISLFINGRKVDKIAPLSGAPDKDRGTLQYRLERNTSNDRIWADILGAPILFDEDFFIVGVKVSVGLENEFALKTSSNEVNFNFIRIHRGWFYACGILIALYLAMVFYLARNRGLLRDRSINLSTIGLDNIYYKTTYSLARFQMAFWFTLTLISFFFIWLITDAYDIITTTILTLIGISAGTSLSAAVIDDSKNSELLNKTLDMQNEKIRLESEVADLKLQTSSSPSPINLLDLSGLMKIKSSRIVEITPVINKNIATLTPQKSNGFFNDVLKDVNGVSFHRLQMLVWTFVLGLIFMYSVWKRLSMPEFSATLLALQGITAGTYLGFKIPEKQS